MHYTEKKYNNYYIINMVYQSFYAFYIFLSMLSYYI